MVDDTADHIAWLKQQIDEFTQDLTKSRPVWPA